MTQASKIVTRWLDEMRKIWLAQKPDDMAKLLAENLEYYEIPGEDALTSVADVVLAWQEIKTQDIESVEIELLHANELEAGGYVGMAIWKFKQAGESLHHGAYYLELNAVEQCTHFRQWWTE